MNHNKRSWVSWCLFFLWLKTRANKGCVDGKWLNPLNIRGELISTRTIYSALCVRFYLFLRPQKLNRVNKTREVIVVNAVVFPVSLSKLLSPANELSPNCSLEYKWSGHSEKKTVFFSNADRLKVKRIKNDGFIDWTLTVRASKTLIYYQQN